VTSGNVTLEAKGSDLGTGELTLIDTTMKLLFVADKPDGSRASWVS